MPASSGPPLALIVFTIAAGLKLWQILGLIQRHRAHPPRSIEQSRLLLERIWARDQRPA